MCMEKQKHVGGMYMSMNINAPEKIYVHRTVHLGILSASEMNITGNDIEYTRTDALIEKALEFLDGCIPDYIDLEHANVDTFLNVDNKRFIEDFEKYMKGE